MSRDGLNLVMSLYRNVLRVHRDKLGAPAMRSLGDDYARTEFRSHLVSGWGPGYGWFVG